MLRLLLTMLFIGAASTTVSPPATAPALPTLVSDSALAELNAERYWHAARMMRAEDAAEGDQAEVLLLARAEGGWKNWSAVRELLDGADWLADEGGGAGLYLLGRAHQDADDWDGAATRYGQYLNVAPSRAIRYGAAASRRAMSLWWSGDREASLEALSAFTSAPDARSWTALELALEEAEEGDVSAVEALAELIDQPLARAASWRLMADVRLTAKDSSGAVEAFREARGATDGGRRAIASIELGRLLLAAGDTSAARTLLLEGMDDAPFSSRARAAPALLDLRDTDVDLTLELARISDRAGDGRRALNGYDRVVTMSADGDMAVPLSMRVERARLMGTVRARQEAALEEFRAIREETDDDRIGGRNLELWAQLRRRQGLGGHVNTLRRWLLDEYPGSSEAAEVAWSRASQADTNGQLESALTQYSSLSVNAPTHARAGQARMRSGQIYLGRDDLESAVEVFEAYLEAFPDGRRWQEAAFWAGRTRTELGDQEQAAAHIQRIVEGDPVSYYAVMGADLLDVPFELTVRNAAPASVPSWMSEGLSRIDLYTEAGLERAVSAEIAALSATADPSTGDMLSLAEGLNERGRTIDGINLGWALRERGEEWDARLIRVTFPFPYEELVRREAEEWGVDPIALAAIIRQESAFKADIVSRAGAIGLMQVMPPTGAELARAHGPEGFRSANLTVPEVNLHLGAAFFLDMSKRYENVLPLVLSAYNAGPTRANRWRRYPEISDPIRFTERIPFVETRGYVKNVRRNLGLYRVLYGKD
jgi:soluble lytic murein transglycosylase